MKREKVTIFIPQNSDCFLLEAEKKLYIFDKTLKGGEQTL